MRPALLLLAQLLGYQERQLQRLVGVEPRVAVGVVAVLQLVLVHPGQLQGALKEFPEVRRYRAVATREGNRDQVTLYIDTGAALEPALVERLQQRLRDVLRIGVGVTQGDDSRFPDDGLVLADERNWE